MGLKPFGKGLVGLIYLALTLLVTVIATIIGAVKFQEMNKFHNGKCNYNVSCNGKTSYVDLCSATSVQYNSALNHVLVQWGFGLGVAIAACVVAAFQLFVSFRHFAADSRQAGDKTDGSAA